MRCHKRMECWWFFFPSSFLCFYREEAKRGCKKAKVFMIERARGEAVESFIWNSVSVRATKQSKCQFDLDLWAVRVEPFRERGKNCGKWREAKWKLVIYARMCSNSRSNRALGEVERCFVIYSIRSPDERRIMNRTLHVPWARRRETGCGAMTRT